MAAAAGATAYGRSRHGHPDDALEYELTDRSTSSAGGPPRETSVGGLTPRLGRRAASAQKEELIKEWQRLQRQVRADLSAQDRIFGEIIGRPSLPASGDGGIVRLDDSESYNFEHKLPPEQPPQDAAWAAGEKRAQEHLESRIKRLESLEARVLQSALPSQSANGMHTPRSVDTPAGPGARPSALDTPTLAARRLGEEQKTPRGINTILENADQSALPDDMHRAVERAGVLPVPKIKGSKLKQAVQAKNKMDANHIDGVDMDAVNKAKRKGGVPRGRSSKLMHNAAQLLKLDAIGASGVMDFVYHEVLDFRGWMLKNTYALLDWWNGLKEPDRKGCVANFIGSGKFEMITLLVVCANCFFIIYEQNILIRTMSREGSEYSEVLELAFAGYFTLELLTRLAVHRLYFFVNAEMGWNIVDASIVLISCLQVLQNMGSASGAMQLSFLRSFRIMKLVRVLRLVRMVKMFTDLRVMVIAFLNSCMALFWCMVLLVFTIGMFALLFVQLIGDYLIDNHLDNDCPVDPEPGDCVYQDLLINFGSVQTSMLSLYMAVTGGNDWGYYYDMMAQTSGMTGLIFVFYTAFYYFGIFNLLTGMFVDKAVRASQPDQDMVVFEQRLQEGAFIKGFLSIFSQFDHDHDGMIDFTEYETVINSDQGRIFIGVLGLQPADTRIVFDALSRVRHKVPVTEFVQGCMRMRGGATSIDMHSVQFEIQTMHHMLEDMYHEVMEVASMSLHGSAHQSQQHSVVGASSAPSGTTTPLGHVEYTSSWALTDDRGHSFLKA